MDNSSELESGTGVAAPATGASAGEVDWSAELTPRQIVAELDKYIVGTGRGEAGGGDRAAQPLASSAGGG